MSIQIQEDDLIEHIINWSIDRIHYLSDSRSSNDEEYKNAVSISEEFNEWIYIDSKTNELDYMCVEYLNDDYGEQEIDTI